MMTPRWVLLLIAFTTVVSGCGQKKLTSSEAKAQLEAAAAKDPGGTSTITIPTIGAGLLQANCVMVSKCPNRFPGPKEMEKAEEAGFLHTQLVSQSKGFMISTGTYELLDGPKGKSEYVLIDEVPGKTTLKIRLFDIKRIEILGVGEPSDLFGKKVSTVKFSVTVQPTPVGKAMGQTELVKNGEALFALYDSGWKLEQDAGAQGAAPK